MAQRKQTETETETETETADALRIFSEVQMRALDFAVLGGLCGRDHLLAPPAMMEYLAQVRAEYLARFPL